MCLACEMDTLWLAEMVAEAERARAEADGKLPAGQPDGVANAVPEAKLEPKTERKSEPKAETKNPFVCEEIRSE
jgi:hypothetical protein